MEIITASGAIKVRKSSSVGNVSSSACGKICGNLTHNGFGVSAVLY